MSLNPPEQICGELRGRGKHADARDERNEWVAARVAEGGTIQELASALRIKESLAAELIFATLPPVDGLSPPKHIIGPLLGDGTATATIRADRAAWIDARDAEGWHARDLTRSLRISYSVCAGLVRGIRRSRVKQGPAPVATAVVREGIRQVEVPYLGSGLSCHMTVSLPRLPWDTQSGRVAPRPETDPPRVARPLAVLPPRKPSPYQRVRAAIQEVAEA